MFNGIITIIMKIYYLANILGHCPIVIFLASQDALEVVLVSESVTLRTELTDVTLVSEDTYWGLYWQDSGN